MSYVNRKLLPFWLAMMTAGFLSGCCSSRPTIAEFRSLDLARKIAAFEEAYRGGCLRESENVYLGMISDHGGAAANEMLQLIKSPRADFPLRDVILVLGFINANGTELKRHPVYEALRGLASESNDATIREKARKTLIEIDTHTKRPIS